MLCLVGSSQNSQQTKQKKKKKKKKTDLFSNLDVSLQVNSQPRAVPVRETQQPWNCSLLVLLHSFFTMERINANASANVAASDSNFNTDADADADADAGADADANRGYETLSATPTSKVRPFRPLSPILISPRNFQHRRESSIDGRANANGHGEVLNNMNDPKVRAQGDGN